MRTSVGNTAVRVCLGLLVAALHLVALMVVLTASWNPPAPAETDSRALTWVNIEPSERTVPAVPPEEATSEPKMRTRRLTGSSAANVPSANESPASADPAPIRDFRGSMEAAATAAVGKAISDGSYHALGPVQREKRTDSSSGPSILETPRKKAGDIDQDVVQGRTLIWHNAHCFTELPFPTIKDPNALVGAPNPPICMRSIGEREARGDLFESIPSAASF